MQNKNRRRTARMRPAAVAAPNLSAEEDCMVTADEALRPAAHAVQDEAAAVAAT